jgi:hypothetical protein
MNDDDFEKKLQSLTSALHRPDPTPEWKTDILARALREADVARPKRTLLPPRWLMVTWGMAWAAIVVLNLAAPQSLMHSGSSQAIASKPEPTAPAAQTLLAYNRQLNLSIDLP